MTIVEKMLERRAWDWITAENFNDDRGCGDRAEDQEPVDAAEFAEAD